MIFKTCFISFKGNFGQIFTLKATTKALSQQGQAYENQTFVIKFDGKSPKMSNMYKIGSQKGSQMFKINFV